MCSHTGPEDGFVCLGFWEAHSRPPCDSWEEDSVAILACGKDYLVDTRQQYSLPPNCTGARNLGKEGADAGFITDLTIQGSIVSIIH